MSKPKVYALSTCPYCRRTRRFLDELGVPYDVVEVDLLDDADRERMVEEVRSVSGGANFPVVVVNGRVVVGHDEARLREALGL